MILNIRNIMPLFFLPLRVRLKWLPSKLIIWICATFTFLTFTWYFHSLLNRQFQIDVTDPKLTASLADQIPGTGHYCHPQTEL